MQPRLLLVDDDPALLEVHALALSSDYDVSTARDADEALARLEGEAPFALVVSDHDMPGTSGIELLARVRRSSPHAGRVLFSGSRDPAVLAAAVNQARVHRVISKPCDFGRMASELGAVVVELDSDRARLDDALLASIASSATSASGASGASRDSSAGLASITQHAADAAHTLLGGRSVLVQLFDDGAPGGAVEAARGPEMCADMLRAPLGGEGAQVGELVVDLPGGLALDERELALLERLRAAVAERAARELRARDECRGQEALLAALAGLAEHRVEGPSRRLERLARYCVLLAEGLREDGAYAVEITDDFIPDLARAAALHDIGQLALPDAVLLASGRPGAHEQAWLETHAELGGRAIDAVLASLRDPGYLKLASELAWCHHERWDGAGYPRGLAGTAIPLSARILAVADAYDSFTRERPYLPACSHAAAADQVRRLAGSQLDARVVDAFLRRLPAFEAARARMADEPAVPASLPVAA